MQLPLQPFPFYLKHSNGILNHTLYPILKTLISQLMKDAPMQQLFPIMAKPIPLQPEHNHTHFIFPKKDILKKPHI
jgi:hypothetical protein